MSSSSHLTAWAAARFSGCIAMIRIRNVILETLTCQGQRTIMAQHYLPEISHGDRRNSAHRRQGRPVLSGAHSQGWRNTRNWPPVEPVWHRNCQSATGKLRKPSLPS